MAASASLKTPPSGNWSARASPETAPSPWIIFATCSRRLNDVAGDAKARHQFEAPNLSGNQQMRKPGAPNHPFLASSLPGCLIKVSFLFLLWGGTAFAADTGLRDDWVDPETGHRVTRLSRLPGES